MHAPFDYVVKEILRGALKPGGNVIVGLEVPAADSQTVDAWFEPDPGRDAARLRLGLLGRMGETPALFEPFHNTPGLDELRGCFRKQLGLDHSRCLDARKQGVPRPPFPRLWVLTTGRAETVLNAYALMPMEDFPSGFYGGAEGDARGVVVLRELPRTRETLLLRLMAHGAVLNEALAELAQLPPDAWEQEVAMRPLVAARFQIPQDSKDEAEREFLMNTQALYESWKQQVEKESLEAGRTEEAARAVLTAFRVRGIAVPEAARARILAEKDLARLERWHERAIVAASIDEVFDTPS